MREGSQTESHKRGRGYRPVINQTIKPISPAPAYPVANDSATPRNAQIRMSGLATQTTAPLVPNSILHPVIKKVDTPKNSPIVHHASDSKLNMNAYLFTQRRRNHL